MAENTNSVKPPKDDGAETLTAKAVAALLKGNTVRVAKLDRDGNPIMEKGVYQSEERAITAADILSFREFGKNRVSVVTVDGQKLEFAR